MKFKNIMFSGFMAAIIMSAGAAMAEDAVVSVASTGYVDAKIGKISTEITNEISNTYVSNDTLSEKVATVIENADADSKLGQIDEVVTLVGNSESGLVADVDVLKANVGETPVATQIETAVENFDATVKETYQTKEEAKTAADAQKAIDQKQTSDIAANTAAINTLGGGSGSEGVATLMQDVADAKTAIATLNKGEADEGSVAYKIAQAVSGLKVEDAAVSGQFVTAVSEADGKISVTRTALTASDIPTIAQSQVAGLTDLANAVNAEDKGLVATNALASGNAEAIGVLNGSGDGSVAKTAQTAVEGYAVPKPGSNCNKTTCVLTVDQATGTPYWMELALTVPAEPEIDAD